MKAVETEYKKQISQDIPDLWARIEAGVDEYEKTKPSVAETNLNKVTEDKVVNIDSKKIVYTIGKVIGAVACIAIAAVVVFNFGTRTKSETTSVSDACDTVAASSCETADYAGATSQEAAADSMDSYVEYEASEETVNSMDEVVSDMSESALMEKTDKSTQTSAAVKDYSADTFNLMGIINCSEEDANQILVILKDAKVVQIYECYEISPDNKTPEGLESYMLYAQDDQGEEQQYTLLIERIEDSVKVKALYMGYEDDENSILYSALD